jgi:hypothetical protein
VAELTRGVEIIFVVKALMLIWSYPFHELLVAVVVREYWGILLNLAYIYGRKGSLMNSEG